MPFKEHPYFDYSERDDWLAVNCDSELQSCDPKPLAALYQTLQDEKQRLCNVALERIKQHATTVYLAERPHPHLNNLLFHPLSDRGFRVYIEYFFSQSLQENSPDSDFW